MFLSSSGSHGDANKFDGPGNGVAHAFLPGTTIQSGDIHMDADENWTETFMYNVAVHEIGHSLGLGHSGYSDSIMSSSFSSKNPITSLHHDDIDGLKKLYGKK
jgi:predicted Zn-dependent protease